MKKFTKNVVKEFKKSFGRFLAIMAIIALGVGFLIGVSQATPDMKTSMSDYLRENMAYDIDVKAAYGLTSGDIAAIAQTEGEDGEILSAFADFRAGRAKDEDLVKLSDALIKWSAGVIRRS